MNKPVLAIGSLLAALVLFVAVNIVAGAAFRSVRADLTESGLYTLKEGSRNIAANLQEPVKLTLYYSASLSNDAPGFKPYYNRVKETLLEFARASRGRVTLEIVDPEPFSDAEDSAVEAGLAGLLAGRGTNRFYFGMVGVNSTDATEVIKFFDPGKETFLEHDIARALYLLSSPKKATVGVMSWLPVEGVQDNPFGGPQGGSPPWQITTQMKEFFTVKTVATDATEIPADIGVLMIVHPKGMSPTTQYAVDQFVMRGGRLLVFVDPNCELDTPPGVNPMQALGIPKNSDLKQLFDAWGLELLDKKFAGDRGTALRVNVGSEGRPDVADYIAWLRLTKDNVDSADTVTGTIDNMIFATSGILKKKDGAATEFRPLVFTTTDSMAVETTKIEFIPEPKKLLAEFKPGGQALALAARITGKVATAFPSGKPTAPPPESAGTASPTFTEDPNQIKESKEPVNIVVIADCDMLADRFWVTEARLGPVSLGFQKIADNGDLVIGALDNLSGSSDLISLRARGRSQRPFDRVEKIRKEAEQKYLATQQELEEKLRTTEQKISELQRQRSDSASDANALLLTPAQQAEIENFRKEQLATRKELRRVQHGLDKDIENLHSVLQAVNIGAMPLLIGLAAVGLSVYRAQRRTADRTKALARS